MRSAFVAIVVALSLALSPAALAKSKKKKKEYTPRMNGVEFLINQDHAEHPDTQSKSEQPTPPALKEETPVEEKKTSKTDIHEEIRRLAEEARSQHGGAPAGTVPVKGKLSKTTKKSPAPEPQPEPVAPVEPESQKTSETAPHATVAPTIIIDPGHGGKDPGASGLKGKVREKDVILAIAKQLAIALKKKLGAKVFMTRSNDTFITLGERNRIANRRHADMFLSVHGNASTNKKAQGIEIYYLNKATDQASKRLAARENEGSPKAEAEMEAIVSDLLQTAATEESSDLAKRVKGSFEKRLQKKYSVEDVQIKTALFYVLVGAKCPSLLIETGFVTNPIEGRRLTKIAFQKDMANSIADAVAVYWKNSAESGSDL